MCQPPKKDEGTNCGKASRVAGQAAIPVSCACVAEELRNAPEEICQNKLLPNNPPFCRVNREHKKNCGSLEECVGPGASPSGGPEMPTTGRLASRKYHWLFFGGAKWLPALWCPSKMPSNRGKSMHHISPRGSNRIELTGRWLAIAHATEQDRYISQPNMGWTTFQWHHELLQGLPVPKMGGGDCISRTQSNSKGPGGPQ